MKLVRAEHSEVVIATGKRKRIVCFLAAVENQNTTKGVSLGDFCCILSNCLHTFVLFSDQIRKMEIQTFLFVLSSVLSLSRSIPLFGQFRLTQLFTRNETAINWEIEHMLTFIIIRKVHMFGGMGTHFNWYKLNLSIKNVACLLAEASAQAIIAMFICYQNMSPFFRMYFGLLWKIHFCRCSILCAHKWIFIEKPKRSKSPVNQNENKQNTQWTAHTHFDKWNRMKCVWNF